MIDEILKETEQHMTTALQALQRDLAGIRTGRATTTLLDGIRVKYYGTPTPLNQLSTVSAPEPRLLMVKPYENTIIGEIEKAIRADATLGLNPSNDGKVIRIPVPPLTDDRRKELSRLVHKFTEDGRNSVRQVRRDVNDTLKKLHKNHKLGEDEQRHALDAVQKITDEHVDTINELQKTKDEELLQR